METITSPCGHTAAFDDVCTARDRFHCPQCGLRWHVETKPPVVYPSGWVQPGPRIVHQRPHPDDLRARQLLLLDLPAPLSRVLQQAAASNQHRALTASP